MEEMLKIGVIVKPQGIKGEVKVQPLTDDINRFKKLKKVLIDGAVFQVERVSVGGGTVFLALSGINDRDTAESFRGKFLSVERIDAVKLPKDNYFIVDILGCTVITDEKQEIGEVIDVMSAHTDVFTVKCVDGRIMRFPFLKDLLVKVEIENKTIIVSSKRLMEVSCYEN